MWNLPTFFNIQIEVSVAKHCSISVQIYWGWTFSSLVCHNGKETNSTIMLDKVCVYLMYGHWINLTLHYLAQQILTANYYRQYRWLGQDWGRSAENTSLCLYLDDGGCDDDGCKANHREIWNKRFVKKILLLGCDTHRLVFSFNTPWLIWKTQGHTSGSALTTSHGLNIFNYLKVPLSTSCPLSRTCTPSIKREPYAKASPTAQST